MEPGASPERLRPLSVGALASQQRQVTGTVDAAELPRLADAAIELGPITVDVKFGFTALDATGTNPEVVGRRWPTAQGNAQVLVQLGCQRCDLPVQRQLNVSFELVLADEAAALELPRELDVRVISESQVTLAELVEDELLLALPAQVCELVPCENQPSYDFPPQSAAVKSAQKAAQQDNAESGPAEPGPTKSKQWTNGADKPFAMLKELKGKLEN